ncbi:hypothetical protein NKJ26_03015 [Mesorhizobium sp. M0152]|uniref:hypothetical protein n=1 Tax=Mesorhizobium sp. M0152 TaxID=2956898 RepID=UPI00333AD60E
MWQVEAIKERELNRDQIAGAIEYEFELPLVGDRRIGRSADMLEVMEKILCSPTT